MSTIVQIIFVVFFMMTESMDVIRLLIYMLSPMLLSALLIFFIELNREKIYMKLFIYALPNIIFSIIMTVFVQARIDEILKESLKYQSANLEISANNSPYTSLLLILVVSIGLHYVVGQAKLSLSRK